MNKIEKRLAQAWLHMHPAFNMIDMIKKKTGMRIGQILINSITDSRCPDLFYIEDQELMKQLREFMKKVLVNLPKE